MFPNPNHCRAPTLQNRKRYGLFGWVPYYCIAQRFVAQCRKQHPLRCCGFVARPSQQLLGVCGSVDQARKTTTFIDDPPTVAAAREFFFFVIALQQPDCTSDHVPFIFELRLFVSSERCNELGDLLLRNLPPSTAKLPSPQVCESSSLHPREVKASHRELADRVMFVVRAPPRRARQAQDSLAAPEVRL